MKKTASLLFVILLLAFAAILCGCVRREGAHDYEHEHDYQKVVIKAATCTAEGVAKFTCLKCENSYQEVIPAEGHSYSNGYCVNCNDATSALKFAQNMPVYVSEQRKIENVDDMQECKIIGLAQTGSVWSSCRKSDNRIWIELEAEKTTAFIFRPECWGVYGWALYDTISGELITQGIEYIYDKFSVNKYAVVGEKLYSSISIPIENWHEDNTIKFFNIDDGRFFQYGPNRVNKNLYD